MKKNKMLQAGATAGATHQIQTRPIQRILVVDGNPYIGHLNAEVLIRHGYDVNAAEDGATAWEELQVNSYNLLIADHKIPNMSGVELLKKLHADRMALPVILATTTWPEEEFTRYPWLQPTAALIKPYSLEEFLETVKKVLERADNATDDSRQFEIKDNKSPRVEEPIISPIPYQTNPPHRILVVDDDGDARQISIDVLARSGYEVDGVKDGAAGWEALQTFDYDLVVTDNRMPRMTGVEMLVNLRAARMSLPVIMATSHLPKYEFERRPWLKPDLMLERPFTNDELLQAVRKILGRDDGRDDQQESLLPKYL